MLQNIFLLFEKLKAVIFMPAGSAPSSINSIRSEGAEVVLVEGTYDKTVKSAGRITKAWIILILNANPITAAERRKCRIRMISW